MRKWLLAAAAAAIVAAPGLATAQQPMVLKFSHVVAEKTPKGQAALKFKEEAEKLLPGKVKVEVYPNSQLFGDAKEMEALALGDVQFISHLAVEVRQVHQEDSGVRSAVPVRRHGGGRPLPGQQGRPGSAEVDGKRRTISGLAYWHNGMKQISANKPLLVPADAKGLKFRIQQSDILAAQFQALGATPQKLAFSEVYQALQVGTVDGQENTWSNIFRRSSTRCRSTSPNPTTA